MPSLEIQEYSVVSSGEAATSAPNHHRDPREVASFLVKFLSLLAVIVTIAFHVVVNVVICGDDNDEDEDSEMDLESSCKYGISWRRWGTVAFILDLIAVPLLWASAQSTRSRVKHAWMKVVSWFLYFVFSVYGCLIFYGKNEPSFISLSLYFIGALASFCGMMLYVEYHHCRETPSRPDIMSLEISNAELAERTSLS
mmetsp:Transcript_25112/g.47686  ORF Transcript_25112/g.47686 Transcript_25112/m.47686 type:complete len:197 (+) Transcript_25112:313-903(+)